MKRLSTLTIAMIAILSAALSPSALAAEKAPSDQAISDAIEDELKLDQAVFAFPIDITTVDGIVTLDGTVDNILSKERAADIAETVLGVRSVINRIEVRPSSERTGKQIADDIETVLMLDPATDSYELNVVATDGGVVTLTGEVDSWQERRLANTVVKGVSGVTEVRDEITVAPKDIRPDAELKAEIEASLEWDILVDDALIDVEVRSGMVDLSGTVGSAAERSRAFADAWVGGVKSVDASRLEVRRWARDERTRKVSIAIKSDDAVRRAVEDAMLHDPRVNSLEVRTTVDNGNVTLRGEVDNLRAKRAAVQDARNTVGVHDVTNRIRVKPARTPSDEKLESWVRNALLLDPYVDRYEIDVSARSGVVSLYGVVDTFLEKTRADDVVARQPGVVAVNNYLSVRQTFMPYVYDPYVDGGYLHDTSWIYRAPYVRKTDTELKKGIQSQLFWSPFVDSDQVHVKVSDGVVTLTGTVDSLFEQKSAVQNALEGGAIEVHNELTVRN